MARKRSGGAGHTAGTAALLALQAAGVVFTEHPYEHDPAETHFGEETARQLGVERERLLKTLVARTESGLVVAMVPVAGQLDLKALARVVAAKRAELADPAEAERATGYLVGGISPIGQRRQLPMVLDEGALGHRTVLVSGGRRGLQVELSPADLVRLTQARTGAIARD